MGVVVDKSLLERLERTTGNLLDYCRNNSWMGYDPYDGLNSRIFASLPFVQNRIGRLAFMQLMKRSPINLRYLLLVPKLHNPKGISLFSSALLRLSKLAIASEDDALSLVTRLIELRSPKSRHYCWGYNFDWQTYHFLIPRHTPNIICTTFAANALLDAYEVFGNSSYLEFASSAGDFLLEDLNITTDNEGLCFGYTPLDKVQVHNANFLGAALLARLYRSTGRQKFIEHAERAVNFSVRRQRADGSWPYGETQREKWIDNFHTGYNLCALRTISRCTEISGLEGPLYRGFDFYRTHFFRGDGAPKYFHDRAYPVDIHNVAQSIITLVTLRDLNESSGKLALSVFDWAMSHMWDERGYFYYQASRFFKSRIPYMRWGQAWMLLALSILLESCKQEDENAEVLNAGS
jgi:hypothetical protein